MFKTCINWLRGGVNTEVNIQRKRSWVLIHVYIDRKEKFDFCVIERKTVHKCKHSKNAIAFSSKKKMFFLQGACFSTEIHALVMFSLGFYDSNVKMTKHTSDGRMQQY